jgi:hypothetical protein
MQNVIEYFGQVISVDFSDSVQRKDVTTEILERKDKN